jgi:hypothetical protein
MNAATAGDPVVMLWTFHVDSVLKGTASGDITVARYDSNSVSADQRSVSEGLSAVLFLSRDINGARVVIGGNQGLLLLGAGGSLAVSDPALPALSGAESLTALQSQLS